MSACLNGTQATAIYAKNTEVISPHFHDAQSKDK